MTHPTKAIYKWMLSDYVKVSNVAAASDRDQQLYTEEELSRSYEKICTVDYHQEIEVDGIRFTALNAGHVLGAAMFVIEIAGIRVLYTGDYSREEDRHLMAAETPRERPEVLICESTYGVQNHQPRLERERRFTHIVRDVVKRGGRCLIPVFALGRAQELLLILDEFWKAHPDLHSIPVYYASPMANKCMAVYQTYVNMMNDAIRKQITISNPFIFKHVKYIKGGRDSFKDTGPCVMMASPGMLQNGFSRELLELWAPNKANGLLIPGYVVEGTMGKYVLTQPSEILSLYGQMIPLRMSVDYISFSAHVDFTQNAEFIDILKPPHLVLVHGEQNEMMRLKAALNHKYGALKAIGDSEGIEQPLITIHTPRNCETVELLFAGEKTVKVTGKLAKTAFKDSELLTGVLVGKDFDYQIVHPDDLLEQANTKTFALRQRQPLSTRATPSLLEHILAALVGASAVQRLCKGQVGFQIKDAFELIQDKSNPTSYILSWDGGIINDIVADSIMAVILNAEVSPASVKVSSSKCNHGKESSSHFQEPCEHPAEILAGLTPDSARITNIIKAYLEGYFGAIDEEDVHYAFSIDSVPVRVSMDDFSVDCEVEDVREKVVHLLEKLSSLLSVDIVI